MFTHTRFEYQMWIIITFILFAIYFYKKNRHGLHILQLENYYNDRYLAWMKNNIKTVFDVKSIGLLLIPVFVMFFINSNLGILLNCIAYLTLIFTSKRPKEKKPFVVTSRINRMAITYLILIVLFCFVSQYLGEILLLNFVSIFAYVFVYVVNLINRPIEKAIRAKFCRKASQNLKSINGLKVVGITGSYGKTSTKHIVNTILSQKYNTLMTPESYNTTMGVVRTVNEKLSRTDNLFVCEMGAKYVGDIKEICDIVNPTYGIVTAIGEQHLETFKSLDNIRKTKLELVDSLPDDKGIAFVNWEDENIRNSKISKNMVKYGLSKDADYYATNIEITERGSNFDVVIPGKEPISIKTKLLGSLNILNIVGAVAIADKLGLTAEQIKTGAKYIKPVTHRLELKPSSNGSIIIDDAYNSNIRGAKMALEVLKNFKGRQRILITPGIVDLGEKSFEINKELGKSAASSCDFAILVGEKQAEPIYAGLKEEKYPEGQIFIAKNLEEALAKMSKIMDATSVILLENDLPDNYL
ncbi:MAG: Mur ligase family protein [Clostridia bacterium]|nr:Mur ligase family protein [Clostridia bacterium]